MDTNLALQMFQMLAKQNEPSAFNQWIPALVVGVIGLIGAATLWLKADAAKKESETARQLALATAEAAKKQGQDAAQAIKEIHTVVNSRTDALTNENKAFQKEIADLKAFNAQIAEKLRGTETAAAVREAKGTAPATTTVVNESAAESPLANIPIPLPVIPVKPLK